MLGTASTSWAALGVVFSEDFESYNSTTEMEAVWTPVTTAGEFRTEIDDDLDGTPEQTGKFAFHGGAGINTHDLASPIFATTDEWIRLRVDIYDNATNLDPFAALIPDNKRMSLGLRSTTPANLIELGMWNSVADVHFGYRAALFQSLNSVPNPNWTGWDMGTEPIGDPPTEEPINRFRGGAWYTYQVTIKPDSLLFEFDLDYDGTFDFSAEHFDIAPTVDGFNQLRFGGPSGVGSSGGGVTFDNIVLEIIEAISDLQGDLNGDGFVGLGDLDIVLGHWNQNVTPGDKLLGDPSGDGFVGLDDLDTVLGNWNAGTPPAGAVVPEPATLGLIALGGAAMLQRRR
jgi:hypothetical protein